jgi:hypothetical protein
MSDGDDLDDSDDGRREQHGLVVTYESPHSNAREEEERDSP